jgi:hypothetical protein
VRLRRRALRQRGQAVAEFTLLLPIILTMTLAMAEFGVAFGTNMTLVEATREAARVGAVLGNGGNSYGCGSGGAASVDPQIIAAVQRVVESPGSGVTVSKIVKIHIFESDGSGGETAFNEWTPGAGPTICGVALHFVQGAVGWTAASRTSTLPSDSLGVSITYTYTLFTPLGAIAHLFGAGQITMTDSAIFDLAP